MKERICLGFKFSTFGPNCTLDVPKDFEQSAIASAFPECKEVIVKQCRRRKLSALCERGTFQLPNKLKTDLKQLSTKMTGKHHAQRSANLALMSTEQMIRRTSLSNVRFGGPVFPVDCMHTGHMIRQSSPFLYGIESFTRCCSVCQKGRLYAIEVGTCRHRTYVDPLLEFTFNECCFSRLYASNAQPQSVSSTNNANSLMANYDQNRNLKHSPSYLQSSLIKLTNESVLTSTYQPSKSNRATEDTTLRQIVTLLQQKMQLDTELVNVAKANLLLQMKAIANQTDKEESHLNELEKQQVQSAIVPIKKFQDEKLHTESSALNALLRLQSTGALEMFTESPSNIDSLSDGGSNDFKALNTDFNLDAIFNEDETIAQHVPL